MDSYNDLNENNKRITVVNSYDDEAGIRAAYHDLTLRLIEKGLQITTMESATSGQIASLITDTEGSSAVIKGAFITYSAGATSRETARDRERLRHHSKRERVLFWPK